MNNQTVLKSEEQREEVSSAALLASAPRSETKRRRKNFIARILISSCGFTIIFSIVAILAVIVWECLPLFRPAKVTLADSIAVPKQIGKVLLSGIDEYQELPFVLEQKGLISFIPIAKSNEQPEVVEIPGLNGDTVTAAQVLGDRDFLVGLSSGRAVRFKITYQANFADGARTLKPAISFDSPIILADSQLALDLVHATSSSENETTVGKLANGKIALSTAETTHALIGPSTTKVSHVTFIPRTKGIITSLAVDHLGKWLITGDSAGDVTGYLLQSLRMQTSEPVAEPIFSSHVGSPITALSFLIGDRTLVVGEQNGSVSSLLLQRDDNNSYFLQPAYNFQALNSAVAQIRASHRNKGFIAFDQSGTVSLNYATTGKTLLSFTNNDLVNGQAILAPKSDGIVLIGNGQVKRYLLDNPHPEVSFGTLFGKNLYEGYKTREYVWQSTGGTDDSEPKLSLIPLLYGTLKGTFYALLFAVPLALLGAIYTSQFMHPDIRNVVKPAIELMAALPSVVVGFIAGLWLAPKLEPYLTGVFISPVVIGLAIVAAVFVRYYVLPPLRILNHPAFPLVSLVLICVCGFYLSLELGQLFDSRILQATPQEWLLHKFGINIDQRNSIVVGFAMGFAVIPLIFTVAEDSLSNVPKHLRAAALALGANEWQTAIRVILPTASPAIFSAVMIGFGRAVGETMIVLMATGNTAIMNASPFNGFRALSANIAVELPEAPQGGTLYRVLFVSALLLFILTFIVNTVSELVRLKLRKRYAQL